MYVTKWIILPILPDQGRFDIISDQGRFGIMFDSKYPVLLFHNLSKEFW